MMKMRSLAAAAAAMMAAAPVARADDAGKVPLVFAAASMKTALDAIDTAWTTKTGKTAVVSYGSSGTLAKQIEGGAPADLFISADEKWMDVLEKDGALKPGTRENLVGNTLVLVASKGSSADLEIGKGFALAKAIGDGKLAVCTVSSCPAGIYGKEALTRLGVWDSVLPKLAQAENVRAALLLVARGEAAYGIVYATDAKAEPKVRVVGTFPEDTHTPIVYPIAVTKQAKSADAAELEAFMHTPEATKILRDQGFAVLGK
jgi:molybdate transport system substrate-binding protein